MEFERWKEIRKLRMAAKSNIEAKQQEIAEFVSKIDKLDQEERNFKTFKDWMHHKWDKEDIKEPTPYCENECEFYRPIMCLLKEPIISHGKDGDELVIDSLIQCGRVYECEEYESMHLKG